MSTSSPPGSNRPLSPFMIGPYYRPQLTSVLSITHRITGVFLCLGGPLGMLLVAGSVLALWFHFFNGIRHLFWDVGSGLSLPSSYRSGYLVLVGAALAAAANLWLIYGRA